MQVVCVCAGWEDRPTVEDGLVAAPSGYPRQQFDLLLIHTHTHTLPQTHTCMHPPTHTHNQTHTQMRRPAV